MNKLKQINKPYKRFTCIALSLSLVLSGCALKTRSANDLPPAMKSVYIDSSEPYGQLTTQLTRQLKALNIHVVNSAKQAPVTLRITANHFTADLPKLITSASTFSYTYKLATQFELRTKNNKLILSRSLSTSDSLIQNAQQIYTPDATALMKRELTHTMATLIYEQLTTSDVEKRTTQAVNAEKKAEQKKLAQRQATKKTTAQS